jgi:hypothetical protein
VGLQTGPRTVTRHGPGANAIQPQLWNVTSADGNLPTTPGLATPFVRSLSESR